MPRWRRNSYFGPGPRIPLDREQRARVLFLARMHRRPGRLSAGGLQVLVALVRLLGADGRLDPCHATLAALATVSVDTVQRALVRLRGLGLLTWQRRLVRDEASGWRCEQTSNAYVLMPAACEPQIAAPVQLGLKKKGAPEGERVAPEVRHAAQLVLDRVRQHRMRVLGLGWH